MLGNVIKVIRIISDDTKSNFAGKIEVSRSYITKIESGIKVPALKMVKRVSNIYNIPVSKIYELDKLDDEKKLSYKELLKLVLDYYLCEENEKNDCHQKVKK